MKITFTPAAIKYLDRYQPTEHKLMLDYDDGVGPFSKLGNCSMEDSFKLLFVDPDLAVTDFNAVMDSNLGPIYYKDYTQPQFDDEMKVDFNPKYFLLPLSGPSGRLTENLELQTVTEFDLAPTTQGVTHDC